MVDYARISSNIAKLVEQGAPDSDIDEYLGLEGVSFDDMRDYAIKRNQPELKPLTEEQKAKPQTDYTSGVVGEGLKGFASGVGLGLENVAQGATLGAYGKLNELLGGDYAERQKENQMLAENEGLGGANLISKGMANIGGAGIGAPTAIYKGIGGLGLKGITQALASGALEGGIAGGLSAENVSDILPKAITGTAIGGVSGLAGDVAGKAIGSLYRYARPKATAMAQGFKNLRDSASAGELERLAEETARTGKSAIELGDFSIVDEAIRNKFISPDAKKKFVETAQGLADTQTERNLSALNKAFGSKSKIQSADELVRSAKEQAQPLYEQLDQVGDVAELNPEIKDILKDDYLLGKLNAMKSNTLLPSELRNASNTDFRKLNLLKQSIDQDINVSKLGGKNWDKSLLQGKKQDLLNKMDKVLPEYKTARGIYENEHRFLDAQEIGSKALNKNQTVESLENQLKGLSANEQEAVKIGARDRLVNDILNKENQTSGLKLINNENSKAKLRLILGKNEADDLINHANREIKSMRNINKILGGSQTAEKTAETSLRDTTLDILRNPQSTLGVVAQKLGNPAERAQADVIANLLTEKGGSTLKRQLLEQQRRDAIADVLNSMNVYTSGAVSRKILE